MARGASQYSVFHHSRCAASPSAMTGTIKYAAGSARHRERSSMPSDRIRLRTTAALRQHAQFASKKTLPPTPAPPAASTPTRNPETTYVAQKLTALSRAWRRHTIESSAVDGTVRAIHVNDIAALLVSRYSRGAAT